jgi:hypothetical protein
MKKQKTDSQQNKKPKRRKNLYFTKVHEEAVVKYARTEDNKVRTELYIELLQPAFSEMVDKIIYTYKFTTLPNIDVLREECKLWLATILNKYDPDRGSKAFSYFSVITKNWFIHKVKKNSLSNKREVQYDNIPKHIETEKLTTTNGYEEHREDREYWEHFWLELKSWDTDHMKPNEKKVYEAIKIIMSNSEDIEIFNKKAVYLYLREITGLNTKQVVNNLARMRKKFSDFQKKWNRGDF